MKKILTIIALVACTLFAKAQITITSADFGTIGFIGVQNNDLTVDTAYIHVGIPSALAQVWNFDSLHITYQDTIKFLDTTGTPFVLAFPNANMAVTQTNSPGFYDYFRTWTDSVKLDGVGIPTHVFTQTTPAEAVRYNPPQMYLKFPSTYNSNFTGGTRYTYTIDTTFVYMTFTVDTIQERYYVRDTSQFDAWGTMITPLGSFSAIRQRYAEHRLDSTWAYIETIGWQFVNTSLDSSLYYRWFANAENIAIVEVTMDSTWLEPNNVVWLNAMTTSVQNISNNQNGIIVYPNPASNIINISKSNDNPEYVLIYDLMGRLVNETLLIDRTTKLSTSNYSNGLYSYRILDINKINTISTGKFIINN
jgi:hypothetical protein